MGVDADGQCCGVVQLTASCRFVDICSPSNALECPRALRKTVITMREVVSKKYPEAIDAGVAGFGRLRCINHLWLTVVAQLLHP